MKAIHIVMFVSGALAAVAAPVAPFLPHTFAVVAGGIAAGCTALTVYCGAKGPQLFGASS